MKDRRVLEGDLGCPNCRERYPVREGFGDLRPPPRTPLPDPSRPSPAPAEEELVRLAALLGVAEGPGQLLLVGAVARFAPGLAGMLRGVEVVAAGPTPWPRDREPGVSRLVVGASLPVYSRTLRGVALEGEEARPFLEEAARTLAPLARVVVLDAPPGTLETLEEEGLTPVLQEEGVVVAMREGVAGTGPPPGAAPPGTGPAADGSGRLPVVP